MDRKAVTRMIFAESITLFVISWKLTNGEFDRFSIITKSTNDVMPTTINTNKRGFSIPCVCENDRIIKNEIIVTAKVIVPFISIFL